MKNSDCLKLSCKAMASNGVWVPDSFENSSKWQLFLVYRILFLGFVFSSILMAEFCYLYQNTKDTDKMIESVVLFGTHLTEVVKAGVICFRQDRIKRAVQIIDGPFFTRKDDPVKMTIIEDTVRFTNKIGHWVIWSVFISGIIYSLSYISVAELPLRVVFPFDTNVYPRLPLLLLFSSISVCLLATADAGENFLVYGLMTLTGAQLDVLRYELQVFNTRAKNTVNTSSAYEDAIACVKYHHRIIEYVEELASIFGISIFVQLCSSSITICMTAFQMSKASDIMELTSLNCYLGCVLVELMLYCYAGDQLRYKSLLVSEAAYAGNWEESDSKARCVLLLLALRAQRPLLLCVGGIFNVSLPTAAKVVKTGYTYFTMLQQTRK